MYPFNPPPSYPFYPIPDSMTPEKFYKKMMKAQTKAVEREKQHHKTTEVKKKSKWETLDILHMFLLTLVSSIFIGPFMGIQLIHFYKWFGDTLSTMLK